MRRLLLLAIPVACAAALLAAPGARDPVAAVSKTTPVLRHAFVPDTRAPSPTLDVGVEHAYDVSLDQSVRPHNGDEIRVAATGTWAVAYAGSDASHLPVFRAELRDAKVTLHQGTSTHVLPVDAFARPYYFTTAEDSRLVHLHFAPGLDELARGTLTALTSVGQRSAVAADSLGDYEASYREDPRGIHRKRVRYSRVVGGGDLAVTIVETGTDIAVRSDGWPASIAGREVTRVGNDTLGVVAHQQFALRHAKVARIDAGWPDGLEVVAVDAAMASAHAEELEDRELVGGATFGDLMAELAKIEDGHARGYQVLRLASLFRLDPNSVDEAARAIAADDPAAGMLVGALGHAGTPRAQAALSQMLDTATLDEQRRVQAAVALGLTETPTRETLDKLAQVARRGGTIANTSLLALGNAASRIADDDRDESARRVDELLARLARASTDDERVLVLAALGNTGDARILPALSAALATRSIPVRVAATEALRLVPGSEPVIAAALRDPVTDVRAAAVFACELRDLGVLQPMLAVVVQREPDVTIRRAVIELAGSAPPLRQLLVYAAAKDSARELRELAARLLAERDAA